MRYWLDADVIINAHNTHYPVGIANSFWIWLDGEIAKSTIVSPRRVFNEVIAGRKKDDKLRLWISRHKGDGLCMKTSKEVDNIASAIGDYVFSNPRWPSHQQMEFARGGDAWLIAAAKHDNGTVVSNESKRFPNAKKVRIPDVCDYFQVRCLTMDQLIREMNAQF
jgi:hypothetical protein